MFNVVIYWVSLGSNGIFYNLNGTESKVFVSISKVVKLKLEEFSGMPNMCILYIYIYTKQKHLGCKKVRGQSEATLQTGRHDQKV